VKPSKPDCVDRLALKRQFELARKDASQCDAELCGDFVLGKSSHDTKATSADQIAFEAYIEHIKDHRCLLQRLKRTRSGKRSLSTAY